MSSLLNTASLTLNLLNVLYTVLTLNKTSLHFVNILQIPVQTNAENKPLHKLKLHVAITAGWCNTERLK